MGLAVFLLQRCHFGEYIHAFILEDPRRVEVEDARNVQRDVHRQRVNGERVSDGQSEEHQASGHLQPRSHCKSIVQESQIAERSQHECSVHVKLGVFQHLFIQRIISDQ